MSVSRHGSGMPKSGNEPSSQFYKRFTGLYLQVCKTCLFLKSRVATS